jgi:hypothetical protein
MEKKVAAQIQLTLFSDGTLDISGPTENRMLFFGMVELAKAELIAHHVKTQSNRVVAPTPSDLKLVPR